MSSNEDLNKYADALSALSHKHKQERKELQAKIQGLKKSATKGDKKKKKEVQEEIVKLEAELDEKHNIEETDLKQKLLADEENLNCTQENSVNDSITEPLKVSKAQKRREKKSAANQQRAALIEAQEIENLQGPRHKETVTITEMLKKRSLAIHTIPADGNCLYSAIQHQLKEGDGLPAEYDYKKLRKLTADHLRCNAEEFLPFLSNFKTGEQMSDKDFEEYCSKVEKTTAWGGQIELRALANVLQRPIEVIQATGPPLLIGEEFTCFSSPLIVTFHRFMYRLGEHYNSVAPFVNDEEQEN